MATQYRIMIGALLMALLLCTTTSHPWDTSPIVSTVALEQSPVSVVVDPRTGRAYVATSDANDVGGISVIDTDTGALVRTVQVSSDPFPPTLSLDERTGHAFVLNTAGSTITMGASPSQMVVDEQAGRVFVASYGGLMAVIDTRTGAVLHAIHVDGSISALAADQRAGRVIVASYGNAFGGGFGGGYINTYDAASGRLMHHVGVGFMPGSLVADERIARAFAAGDGGSIDMLDTGTGALLRTITVGQMAG